MGEVALKEPTPDEIEAGDEKVDECTFEQSEVYAVDVAMSTGEGKPRPSGVLRTTVFKRNVEANYRLKMKNSRYLLSEVDKKFPTLPFRLAHFVSRAARAERCQGSSLQMHCVAPTFGHVSGDWAGTTGVFQDGEEAR